MASGLSDVAANQKPTGTPDECPGKKRSKFQTFKKLFAKNKQNEAPSPTGFPVLKSIPSTDDVITPEASLVQSNADHDSESKVNMGNKALSRDGVFLSSLPSPEPNDGLISSQENIHGEVKSLQAICVGSHQAGICPKKGDESEALSEDDGLPHSPPEICTLHTALAGSSHSPPEICTLHIALAGSSHSPPEICTLYTALAGSSHSPPEICTLHTALAGSSHSPPEICTLHTALAGSSHSPPEICTLHTALAGSAYRSSNPVQRTRSLSLEGWETDDDQLYSDTSSRPATPLMSLPVDFSLPASPAGCLDSSAARHRIAIKHKAFAKRKPARREMSDGSKSKVLGEALGLNEELSLDSTEPTAQEQGCEAVRVEQKHTGGDSIEEHGERTGAPNLSRFQQAGEDCGIVVQLSLREEDQSTVQHPSDMGFQHMGVSISITESKLDTQEILPALELVQEFQQPVWIGGGVNGPLLQEMPGSTECTPTVLPVSEPEGEVPETQQGCRMEVSLGEGQATPDVSHVEELLSPGPDKDITEQNEEECEESGECDGEKEFASQAEDQSEEHCMPEEEEEEEEEGEQQCVSENDEEEEGEEGEGEEQCLKEEEEEEEGEEQCLKEEDEEEGEEQCLKAEEEEELEEDCMKAEVASDVYRQDSPRQVEEEEEPVLHSADEADLLSNTYFNSERGSNASSECTMELSWSLQAVEGGKCPPEPPITNSLNSDSVLPCLEETCTTTANISLRVASELSAEKHALSQASDELRKPQAGPGSKAHFTIAPSWQRLLPTVSYKELLFTAPVEPESSEDSPRGARDPHHEVREQNEGLSHPQDADDLSWPDEAQSAALLSTTRGNSPEEVGSAESPFGVKLRKTPEMARDAPERKVASPSWICAARQKQKAFKNILQEETPTRQSSLEIEPKRKISLPTSLNQNNAEQPEPSSSPLTAISCSRDISRPAIVEERKRALPHCPTSPLGQDEPPWLTQAKKKAKAWSEMPQTAQ